MAKAFILLVEDDRITRTALHRLLSKAGFVVRDATTVKDGMDIMDEDNIQTAVIDLMLPDGTGEVLIRRAKVDEIKVIVTTGVGDESRLEEIRKLNPDALMLKPISWSELIQKVRDNS